MEKSIRNKPHMPTIMKCLQNVPRQQQLNIRSFREFLSMLWLHDNMAAFMAIRDVLEVTKFAEWEALITGKEQDLSDSLADGLTTSEHLK